MNRPNNPFITFGYESPEYFCDRKQETQQLISLLTNENHVALISPRRMGKTGLIWHCFAQDVIKEDYLTFMVDIYATKNLTEFVYRLGKEIVSQLRPWGQNAINKFLQIVTSLRTGISFDGLGNPSWNLEIGDISTPEFTLDEIFNYLRHTDKRCIVAIDEFQSIANYPELNVEELLRTYIQQCRNAIFIFSGSQRNMMSEIFTSASRPFYQSVTMMNLGEIDRKAYVEFAQHHFSLREKRIEADVVEDIYSRFEGTTWYIQKMLNELFLLTETGKTCTLDMVNPALQNILKQNSESYRDILYLLPSKQKQLLQAISKENKAKGITGKDFIKRNHLDSASSVQKSTKALLAQQLITNNRGTYSVYDRFLALWLEAE